ncbi:hypothetical protein PUNSTDRAFT_55344 [Punctularia strigosozonata HHB-11173 SS5]|uniref:Uncharacterized protein n=1 Tax=Punctularia strigosozonata (strain HHB-11173) TaxID=741275 RepID=R7S423_PUNST|nr:uncharacterized protein PUNSTDRAFT_55344 [Punctularia strigosozonata HHB-11173 SS5]EIN04604.1 hypothetical protein PUNSTDRAFT_55344 [Punctularia strigosozonata HHB-11173 SS5]
MDFLKQFASESTSSSQPGTMSGANSVARPHDTDTTTSSHSSSGGLMGKLNSALGGGAQGEKKEDALDKGVDWVQEHILGQGNQSNESALEQAKDEQISDAIRRGFKTATGHDIPVKDKS